MLWIVCSLAALSASPELPAGPGRTTSMVPDAASPVGASASPAGTQWQATSENFTVRSFHPSHDARQVAEYCEKWRAALQRHWCPGRQDAWSPKCEIVIHASSAGYLAAAGAGASQTFGSSLIQFAPDKTVARRLIDFRGDSPHGIAALPHEMTHVVLADLLDGRQPPRWADEGMAILADTHDKQMLHERDLAQGQASRLAFRLPELLALNSYPHPARVPCFYGQSASVTALLARRAEPQKFVQFLRRSLDAGYDRALREVYQIDSIAELEQLWHKERQAAYQAAGRGGYHGLRLAFAPSKTEATAGAE